MNKNHSKRINYKNFEKQNLILKILNNNKIIPLKERDLTSLYRHNYGKKSSITLIRNNCINTGRNRGILPSYRLSRFEFKKYITKGYIPGIRKI